MTVKSQGKRYQQLGLNFDRRNRGFVKAAGANPGSVAGLEVQLFAQPCWPNGKGRLLQDVVSSRRVALLVSRALAKDMSRRWKMSMNGVSIRFVLDFPPGKVKNLRALKHQETCSD